MITNCRWSISRPRSWTAATKGSAVSPGCIYDDPPDPECRIRISAAVTAQLLGEALRVVFAVRPDDEVSRYGRTRHPRAARYPASATTSSCDGNSTRTSRAGRPGVTDASRSRS
jgi:hypothetical protein